MADVLLGSTVHVLVERAISLASQRIGLFLGLKKDLEKLKKLFTVIQVVLHDAEKKQDTQESVKLWLKELKRLAFDADNLLDDFSYEVIRRKVEIQNQTKGKVCFFFSLSNPIAFQVKMTNKIRKINMDLQRINEEAKDFGLQSQPGAGDDDPCRGFIKNRETDSVTMDSCFVGRDDDVSAIITDLIAPSNNESISILPIVGMGGIGKTTLARKVFNDPKIKQHFDKRIWVCVSDDFKENRLFGLILETLQGRKPEVEGREARVLKIKELLKGKKYLLVLDDVWNDKFELWDSFLRSLKGISSSNGNCILLTTRKQQVATTTRISFSPCFLKNLSDEKCWLILKENAFCAGEMPDELQDIGFKIAQKCDGLPLAASVLGSMLRNKGREEWVLTLEIGLRNLGGGENRVTNILKLSFDHLPFPSLKKCLAYCSIFPKDFEIQRNQLIQLWAAEGFLHLNPITNLETEKVGEMFFTTLLDSNLLQEGVKDEYGNLLNCKMHDLVHDLVLSISESKTLRLKESRRVEDHDPIQYLVMERSDGEEKPFPLDEHFKCTTTLVFLENKLSDNVIAFLTCLRVLNLASSDVHKLPKSIGKLSHLRYLDLSDTTIEILLDSICKLYNLQTLRARNCQSLRNFPTNFKNLVNLRHFDFFTENRSSNLIPLEIGQLKYLQTLPFFNIGKEKGRRLGELRSLENLSGYLEIRNLELVKNKDEAEFANLVRKSNICELRLLWGRTYCKRENESNDNQVLEGLQPHPNLKGLVIKNFLGDQLSLWIEKLQKLVRLELVYCEKCTTIPALGHMPFLKFLKLEGLYGVTSIGPSFYGGGMTRHSGINSSNQGSIKLFSALEHFILIDMPNLTEWVAVAFHNGIMLIFSVLKKIEIRYCPQLATLPSHFPNLQELKIDCINHGSAVLTSICNRVSSLTDLSICRVSQLTELPYGLFQNNPNLARLKLYGCPDLTQILDVAGVQTSQAQNFQIVSEQSQSHTNNTQHLVGLGSLQELDITFCWQLKSISIPRVDLVALRSLSIGFCDALTTLSIPQIVGSESESESSSSSTSNTCPLLQILAICGCPNLISFPVDLNRTTSLATLVLPECNKLTDLPKGKLCSLTSLRQLEIGPFSNTTELHSFRDLFNGLHPQHLPLLRLLTLYGWPHWECLPDQLQHLSALEELKLDGFGVNSLPDWFGKLSSLEFLGLFYCENLANLPSHQSMRSLTKLSAVRIIGCPLLKERCNHDSSSSSANSEWSKISHIPDISINGERIRS